MMQFYNLTAEIKAYAKSRDCSDPIFSCPVKSFEYLISVFRSNSHPLVADENFYILICRGQIAKCNLGS